MARIKVYATTGEITLGTSGGWKTLLMYQEAAGNRSAIDRWGVYPMGSVNSDPHVRTRLIRAADAGTDGTAVTATVINGASESVRGTFKQGTFTVEPDVSGKVPLDLKPAHPQGGVEYTAVDPGQWEVPASGVVCIQYWNDSGAAVKVTADIGLEQ